MMFVDASAVVAILTGERDGEALAERLDRAEAAYISPIAIFESVAAVTRIRAIELDDARRIVEAFIEEAGIRLIEITEAVGRTALQAFARYGKGRHPAALNLGDCFAYACAKDQGVPLLFKGDDFAKTDIRAA